MLTEGSRKDGSSFEVYFVAKEENGAKKYNYGFEIDESGVKEECLNYKAETAKVYRGIFYRSRDKS